MATDKTPGGIDFTPLSKGLGFHPFSDGLPYAPQTSSRVSTRVAPSQTASAPAIPVAIPAVRQNAAPALVKLRQATHQAAQARTVPSATQTPSPARTFGFGYLLKRIVAYALDLVFASALGLVVLRAILKHPLAHLDIQIFSSRDPGLWLAVSIVILAFSWVFITLQEVIAGTSIGKTAFGLELRGTLSARFMRAFFFGPSVAFGGMGLLWALFNKRRQCWHDAATDLQPEER